MLVILLPPSHCNGQYFRGKGICNHHANTYRICATQIIGQCDLYGGISAVIKEIAVNYYIITILNVDNSRLSKQCVDAQITIFLFFQQGGISMAAPLASGMLQF